MKNHKLRTMFSLAAAASAVVLFAACDDVLQDATFRMWCGESLCAWKTEAGSIRRAPTWHKNDFGVELVDTPTVISQTTDKSPKCLTFTTIADVDPSAQVTIGVDFNADGTIENEQPIAATGFREAKTQVTAPAYYEGIRFVISKKGAGRAVLAQMRVQSGDQCSAPAVELAAQPLGTPCAPAGSGDECSSGVCCDGLCAECCDHSRLLVNEDGGLGSTEPVACPSGGTCAQRSVPSARVFLLPVVPMQCDPGAAKKTPGAECVADDDCASGACDGAEGFSQSADGGACDADFPDAGACLFRRVRGGRCK